MDPSQGHEESVKNICPLQWSNCKRINVIYWCLQPEYEDFRTCRVKEPSLGFDRWTVKLNLLHDELVCCCDKDSQLDTNVALSSFLPQASRNVSNVFGFRRFTEMSASIFGCLLNRSLRVDTREGIDSAS